MVAYVSGNSLGWINGSAGVLGSAGQVGNASVGNGNENVMVNAATGNLILSHRDEYLSGLGLDLPILRTYNSQGLLNDDNGDNWRLGYSRTVSALTGTANTAGSTVTRTGEDGAAIVYTYDTASGKYISDSGPGARDTLSFDSTTSSWTWTDGSSQTVEHYGSIASGGQLQTVTDKNGNTVTLTWNNGLLTSIANADGERVDFLYDTTAGHTANLIQVNTVTKANATDATPTLTQTRVRYGYDSQNRLTSVTVDLTPADNNTAGGKVYTTTYTYDGTSDRVASVTQTDGSQIQFVYDANNRISQVKDVRSATDIRTTTLTYGANQTTVTTTASGSALTQTVTMQYDGNGQLTKLIQPGIGNTAYQYDANGNVTQVTDPKGNAVVYGYDSQDNRTYERDAAGNVISRTYSSTNQLLTETRYRTPDPDGAGSQTASQPETTHYAYDANGNLLFQVTPEGRVTEYRYNLHGLLLNQISYTGAQFTGATFDQTALSAWTAQQDLTQTERIDTCYDFRGQVSKVTRYATVNADGTGVADGTQSSTVFIYDAWGELLQTIDPRGVATTGTANDYVATYTYDGLGRTLTRSQTDGNSQSLTLSSTAYNDALRQSAVTLVNGLTTVTTYDQAGHAVSAVQADSTNNNAEMARTDYVIDVLGRTVAKRITTTTGSVLSSYALYDANNRKVADIDATGALTEYVYNADSQIVETIAYAALVPAASLSGDPTAFTLSNLRPASNANDRTARNLYDAAGRLVKTIDAEGAVTQYQYDGTGKLAQTTQFANRLTTAQMSALAATNGDIASTDANATPVTDAANDRIARNFYSDDGLLLGALDAEGYLTEYRYDGAGQRVQTIQYATVTTASLRSTAPDVATLRPSSNAGDITTTTLYNDEGQVTGVIDGEGYLTETQYDIAGNVAQTIRYANKVTTSSVVGATVSSVRPSSTASDRKVISQYDAYNRLTQTQSLPDNLTTTYQYDNAGNLTAVSSGTTLRQVLKRYDVLGRVTAELSGENAARITSGMTQAQIDSVWAGYATHYTYNESGLLTCSTDEIGRKAFYYYDNDGRQAYVINAAGEVAYQVYDAFGGKTETWRYQGRLSATQLASLTGGMPTTALTNAIAAIASSGIVKTKVTYTLRGQIANAYDGLNNNVEQRTYNAFGQLTQDATLVDTTKPMRIDTFAYDRRGLDISEQNDLNGVNATTANQYDAFGRLTQSTGPTGVIANAGYDRLGRTVTTSIGGTGNGTTIANKTIAYDAFGRALSLITSDGTTTYTYDDVNRKLTVTTPGGISTSTTHDEFGQTVTVTDGRGNATSYDYNLDGQVKQVTDPVGNVTTTYDAAGQVFQTTDRNGIVTQYAYDAAGRVFTRTVDPSGLALQTTYAYDALGEAVWKQDANGVWTRTDYDADGHVTAVTVDPAQVPDRTQLPGAVALVANSNASPLNLQTTYTYDAAGHTLTVTEGAGSSNAKTTQYGYDNLGRRICQNADPNGLKLKTLYSYDDSGNLVQKTDANGNKSYYGYDVYGRQTVTVDLAGSVTQTVYDALNRVVQVRQYKDALTATSLATLPAIAANGVRKDGDILALLPNGAANTNYVVTQSLYNADGQQQYTIDAAGDVTRYDYDASGNVIAKTRYANALSNLSAGASVSALQAALVPDAAHDAVTRYVYDGANRLVWSIDPEGDAIGRTYDKNGNVVRSRSFITPLTAAQLASLPVVPKPTDISGLIVYNNSDRITRTVYDAAGRVQYAIDGAGGVTYNAYDKDGNVVYSRAYVTALTASQLSALTNGVIQPSEITAVLIASANDRITRTVYDAAGRTVWNIDANGDATRVTYDGNGNVARVRAYATPLTAAQLASLALTENVAHIDSLVTADTTNDHITSYAYDTAGRLVWSVDPEGNAVRRSYDANGNVVRSRAFITPLTAAQLSSLPTVISVANVDGLIAYSNSDRITRTVYDADNRVQYAIDAAGDVTLNTYDALGNVTGTIAYATPLTSTQLAALTNGVVQPSEITAVLATSSNDRVTQRVYDNAGRLNYIVDALNYVTASSYDALGRVKTTTRYAAPLASTPAMTMSGVATAVAGIANAANDQTDTFNYDRAGRLTSSIDALGYMETYQYDGLGNKISFTNKKGSTWTYLYDNDGRLTQETSPMVMMTTVSDVSNKVTVGATGSYALTTVMQYDALGNLVSRTEASGRPEARTTQYQYDNVGHQTKTIFPKVAVYNAAGDTTATLTAAADSGSIARVETTRDPNAATPNPLFSQVAYDAFGNAVANIDVSGNISVKAYDRLGRVKYDVDALGYVTQYDHDAFGDVTTLTRYATATALIPSSIGNAPNAAAVAGGITSNSAVDRVLTTQYDALGRAVTVIEPKTDDGYDPQTGISTIAYSASKTTNTTYDAFGNAVRIDVSRAPAFTINNATTPASWATTRQYFDQLNRKTATVDAQNYLTEMRYDSFGNVTEEDEYATAAASATDTSYVKGLADPTDRKTQYAYDRDNRKTSETRLNMLYADTTGLTTAAAMAGIANASPGSVVTNYGYDKVGNQTAVTDALGKTIYTVYDALGRTTAVLQPGITVNLSDGSRPDVVPLTEFKRDAYGNVVAKIDYAKGTSSVAYNNGTATYTAPVTSADDRTTTTMYDAMGHAIETTDAAGNSSYSSYDAAGHTVKQWRRVLGNDGNTRTAFVVNQYDKLGRQTAVLTPASTGVVQSGVVNIVSQATAGIVTTSTTYNAFGEVTQQGVAGGTQTFFNYDNAGRVWRTNSGDGVTKVMLYDLMGNVTSQIVSATTDLSASSILNAGQAYAKSGLRRTDTWYDALGHVVQQAQPSRTEGNASSVTLTPTSLTMTATSQWVAGNTDPSGGHYLDYAVLAWPSLKALGSGDVHVQLTFTTVAGTKTIDQFYDSETADTGVSINLMGDSAASFTINEVKVTKADRKGVENLIADRTSSGNIGSALDITAPPNLTAVQGDGGVVVKFQTSPRNANSFTDRTGNLVNFGDKLRFDPSIVGGDFDYQVITTRPDGTTSMTSGTVTSTVPTLSTISNTMSLNSSTGIYSWTNPPSGVTQVFNYKDSAGNWHSLPVTQGSTSSSVNLSTLPPATYTYELLWTAANQNAPYAHATGTVTTNLPPITGISAVNGTGTGSASLTWSFAYGGNAYNTTKLLYRPSGSTGAWSTVNGTETLFYGNGAANAPTQVTETISLGTVPSGTYDIEVQLTPNGGSSPTKHATGTLTVVAGHNGASQQVWVPSNPPTVSWTTNPKSVVIDTTGKVFGWVCPPGPSSTLLYRVAGSGSAWSSVTGTIYDTGGSGGMGGGGAVVKASVSYASLPTGNNYEIQLYTTSGTGTITMAATGTLTFGSYQTQTTWVSETASFSNTTPAVFANTVNSNPGTTAISPAPAQTPVFTLTGVSNDTSVIVRPVIYQTVDRWGNVLSITDPRSAIQTVDSLGNVLSITNPSLVKWKTTYTYNANNEMTSQTQPAPGDGSAAPVTTFYYDKLGRKVATRDARTTVSSTVINSDKTTSLSTVNTSGIVNGSIYDAAGNLVQEIHADGGIVQHQYNAFGEEMKEIDPTDPNGPSGATAHTTTYTLDKLGRRVAVAHEAVNVYTVTPVSSGSSNTAQWAATVIAQDFGTVFTVNDGTLSSPTSQVITQKMAYDQMGRLLWQTDGIDSEKTSYGYDLLGNIVTTTNAMGAITKDAYDAHGKKVGETDADGNSATWTYDDFGQLKAHTDLGGASFTYTCDFAGMITSQNTTSTGQRNGAAYLSYYYDTAGQLVEIDDHNLNQESLYAYDRAGHRVSEKVIQGSTVVEDNHLAYDAYGYLRDITNDDVHVTMTYDQDGNRTLITTHVINNTNGANQDSTRYFAYDSMNRQILVDGTSATGGISSTQGHRLAYDQNGNRIADTRVTNKVAYNPGRYDTQGNPITPYMSGGTGEVTESYIYDAMNRLFTTTRNDGNNGTVIDERDYDQAGRLLQSGHILNIDYEGIMDANTGNTSDIRLNQYDAAGHLLYQSERDSQGTLKSMTGYSGIDGVGNVNTYQVQGYGTVTYTAFYTNTYTRSDSYQAKTVQVSGTNITTATTTNTYDANAHLIQVIDSSDPSGYRTFINDVNGNVLSVTRNAGTEQQLVVNGEVLGRYGKQVDPTKPLDANGNPQYIDSANFDFSYQSIRSQDAPVGQQRYTVQSGDTLKGISQSIYGDSSLWYVIADANGLTSDADLKIGQILTIPAKVAGTHNNSTTYKPYDPSDIVGSTIPRVQYVPPKADEGCGAMAMIIMIVVAVVVTVATEGALAGPMGSMLGSEEAGVIAAGAIGGAAGSIASQAVGIAMGAQDGFNWTDVAMGALGGAITAGVGGIKVDGQVLGGIGGLKITEKGITAAIERAVVTNALTQGVAVVTGLQDHFDWRGVAASAFAAGVSSSINEGIGDSWNKGLKGFADFAKGMVSGTASGLVSSIVKGGKIDLTNIAVDAFGNAVANSIVDQMQQDAQEEKLKQAKAQEAVDKLFAQLNEHIRRVVNSDPFGLNTIGGAATNSSSSLDNGAVPDQASQPNSSGGASVDQTVHVESGDTLEKLARANYGDRWRAGEAAMIVKNGIKFNDYGSPLIYADTDLTVPSIDGWSPQDLSKASAAAGAMTSYNQTALDQRTPQPLTDENGHLYSATDGMQLGPTNQRAALMDQKLGADLIALAPALSSTPSGDISLVLNPSTGLQPVSFAGAGGDSKPALGFLETMQEISDALHVKQGFVANSYNLAVRGYMDPNASWFEKSVNFVSATAMAGGYIEEEFTRAMLNIPSAFFGAFPSASQAGTEAKVMFDSSLPTEQRVMGGIAATRDGANAILGFLGPAALFDPVGGLETRSAVPNVATGNAEAAAIRARVEANIAESAKARASSNFDDPVYGLGAREWPPYPGTVGQNEADFTLLPGAKVDRFGPPDGTFLAPEGTPYSQRALKPGTMADDYYVYEVLRPLTLKAGDVAPWFGESGMGTQFRLDPLNGVRRTPATLTGGSNPYLKEIYNGKYWDYN